MRLHQLTLQTPDIDVLVPFYHEILGFSLADRGDRHFTLRAGQTLLTFRQAGPQGYYHFAFNIPPGQIRDAQAWLKGRTTLLADGERTIIDFSNWNAEALYFMDPGGNIVELIARRNLSLTASTPFSMAAVQNVSEIGLPVADVGQTFRDLHRATGINRYWGDDTHFCAAGDEHGLFIIVDQAAKTWYPTDRPARPAPLEAAFSAGGKRYYLTFSCERLSIE